jgi:hypothetical protein
VPADPDHFKRHKAYLKACWAAVADAALDAAAPVWPDPLEYELTEAGALAMRAEVSQTAQMKADNIWP